MMISHSCSFDLDVPEKIGKFKFGGSDSGSVDIYEDRLVFFRKSKTTALMFGAIGSAIEGKGKEFYTLTWQEIAARESKEGDPIYQFSIKDGRVLRFMLTGKVKSEVSDALQTFLNGEAKGVVRVQAEPEPRRCLRCRTLADPDDLYCTECGEKLP